MRAHGHAPGARVHLKTKSRTEGGTSMEPSQTPTPGVPEVDCERYHAVLAVSDVRAAVEFYTTKLGFWSPFMEGDPPSIAGVNLGRVQIFLESGTPCPQGCAVYFLVGDADELHDFHRSMGVEITEPIDDRFYGIRDYTVRDLD